MWSFHQGTALPEAKGWFPYDRGSRMADRRSQKVLRSSAIVCDQLRSCGHMETKVLRSAIETYPIIFWIPTHDSTLLCNKATAYLLQTWLALNKVTLVTRNLWRKLRDINAFTTVTVKISKTKTKRLTTGKKSGRNLIYRRMRRSSNSAT